MGYRVAAIIPARGGSKRISGKNIADFMGRPMLCWTVEAALESGIFADVLVSTDSEEIARVAAGCGALVPFMRQATLADDVTPVSAATIGALEQLEQLRGVSYDVVVQLMPNCPLRDATDIVAAYDAFRAGGSGFQVSVFRYGWMNPWWAMRLDTKTMRPAPLFPDALKMRSQDQDRLYCPTGAVWVAYAKKLKAAGTFYGEGYTVLPMDWKHALDIDDMEDMEMALAVAAMIWKKQ